MTRYDLEGGKLVPREHGEWVSCAVVERLQTELDAIKRTREQERDYADVCYENRLLRTKLRMIYDKWDDGDPCYEDPENQCGYLGNAFKLDKDDEEEIIALIGDRP